MNQNTPLPATPPSYQTVQSHPGVPGTMFITQFDPHDPRYKCFSVSPPKLGLVSAYIEIALNAVMAVAALLFVFMGYGHTRGVGQAVGAIILILVAMMLVYGIRRRIPGLIMGYIVMKGVAIAWHSLCCILVGLALVALVAVTHSSSYEHLDQEDEYYRWHKSALPILIVFFIILLVELITDPIFMVIGIKCRRYVTDYKNAEYAHRLGSSIMAVSGPPPAGLGLGANSVQFASPVGTVGPPLGDCVYSHHPPANSLGFQGVGTGIENPTYDPNRAVDKLPSYQEVVKSDQSGSFQAT